ncbi:MAG: hypothetical protein ACXU9U_02370, partial [Parachlamydiaceae bacterium]
AIFDQKEGWMSHVTSLLKSTFTIGKLYPFPLEWLNGREDRPLMLEFYCETYFQWIELHKTLQDPENPNRFIPPENFIETLFGYVRALEDSLDQAWLLFFVFKLLAKEMSIQTAPDVERYQSLVQSWMLFIESLEPELCHHILELIKTLPLSPKSDFLLDVDVTFFEGLCHCVEEQKRQFKPTHVQVSLLISIFKLYASQFQRDISTTIPEQQAMADRRGKENIDILNRLLTLYSSLDHPGNHLHLLHSLCHSYDSLICLYPLRIGVELEAKKDVASPFLRDLITCIAQVCDDDPKLFGKVNEMMGTILEDYRKAFLSDILKLPVKLKGDEYSVFIQLAKWGLMDESIISHLHNLFIDEMKFWSMEDFSRLLQQISSLKLEREKFAALNWLSPLFQTRVSLDREMSYSSIEKKQKDFAEKWTVLVLMYEVSKSLRCTENRLLIFQKLMSVYLEIGVGLSALEEFNSNFLSNVLEDVLASRCGNHQFFTLFLQLLIDFARLDPTKFLESAIRLLEKIVVEVGARDDGNISILRQLSLSLITFAKLEEAHNQAQRTRFSCLVPLIIEIQQKSFNENQECLAEAVTTWAEIGKEELDFKVLNLQVRTGEVVKTSRMVVAVVSMYSRLFRKDRKGVELEENERHDLLTGPPADIYRNVLPNYLGGTEYLALRAVNRSFASLLWGPLTHLLAWIKGLERKEEPKDLINQLKQDLKALPSPSIFSNQVLSILEVEGDNEQCA